MDEALPGPLFGITINFEARMDLGETSETAYREALEFAAEADRLGCEVIWCPEHHGEESGYVPSPIVGAAAIAGVTKNCRVGTGIALSPLYGHPLRLAEDLVTLDNICGGRLDIGLGQGYRPHEYEQIGLSYKRRTRMFEEGLDILELAWTGDTFNYDGEIYVAREATLRPKPVKPGRPPLWIGATAPEARARVVRYQAGLMLNPLAELEPTARQIAKFDLQAAEAGVGPLPKSAAREIMFGASPQDALDRHDEFLNYSYRVQYSPERTGMTYVNPETGQRDPLTKDHPYYLSVPFAQERWWIGSPEEVADSIVAWQPRLRLNVISFHPRLPGMSVKRGLEELEVMMKQVAPRVREKIAAINEQRAVP